jgi:hypothetical protein
MKAKRRRRIVTGISFIYSAKIYNNGQSTPMKVAMTQALLPPYRSETLKIHV